MSQGIDPRWTEFADRHTGNPWLGIDPLLSADPQFLEILEKLSPGLLSKEDLEFESDLIETAGRGFYFKRAALPLPEVENDLDAQFREVLLDALKERGLDNPRIVELTTREATLEDSIESHREAYVGWLWINRDFRRQLNELKRIWHEAAKYVGTIPCLAQIPSQTWQGDVLDFHDDNAQVPGMLDRVKRLISFDWKQFLKELQEFYLKWELEGLLHWELPSPKRHVSSLRMLEEMPALHDSMLTLCIPWHLLRGKSFGVTELIGLKRETCSPLHLRDWILGNAESNSGLGTELLNRLYKIHTLLDLTILPRYGNRPQFKLETFDKALAGVLELTEDSVKRVRLKLKLQQAAAGLE